MLHALHRILLFFPLPTAHCSERQSGNGTANTALVYHAQQLLSLQESDTPCVLLPLCQATFPLPKDLETLIFPKDFQIKVLLWILPVFAACSSGLAPLLRSAAACASAAREQ